jgi:hypothetical protein
MCIQLRWKWMVGGLALLLALPAGAQVFAGQEDTAQAQLVTVARRRKKKAKTKPAPAVSRAQMELAQQMVVKAYTLGLGLETRQRVALMTRLLYTMRPEVMAAEKQQWAEELFGLAQRLPQGLPENGPADADSERDAAMATAAARLAVYDADRALELLDTLPSLGGRQVDARTMAARLVFAGYLQHHGAAGAQTLLAHGKRWDEHGGFPYGASATALARLRLNDEAAEDFFRQVLVIFERGQEGVYGVSEFAGLLEQAVAMEAISEESAEEAGQSVMAQLHKLSAGEDPWTPEQKQLVVEALNNVRVSAPKTYEAAQKDAPELFAVRAEQVAAKVETPKVDVGLQSAFHELAEAMREHVGPEEMHAAIARGVQLVNAKYKAGACAACVGANSDADGYAASAPAADADGYAASAPAAGAGGYAAGAPAAGAGALSHSGRLAPDAQSWALVSLSALAAPMTIATQLTGIEDPFWHAYFLAIAAQQVGQPNRVADPTARREVEKEEAEPE